MNKINCINCRIGKFKDDLCYNCDGMKALGDVADVEDILTRSKWIPMSERPPEVGQYVLVSTDMNYVATATFQGDYWESTFDLDWEEVVAWMESPKAYEVKR